METRLRAAAAGATVAGEGQTQHIFACISAYPHIHTRTLVTVFYIPLYQIRFVRPLLSLKAVALVKIHYDNNEV